MRHMPPEVWQGGTAIEQLELSLQELGAEDSLGSFGSLPEERALAKSLVPEPKIRELLLAKTEVIVVEAYVALAPRDVAASLGLSEIVQGEFALLLRRAKAEGVAVVLQLGGNNPHLLARKVYMRPDFAQCGLTCGYLRWRSSPGSPWGREQPWNNRVCLGLQLP